MDWWVKGKILWIVRKEATSFDLSKPMFAGLDKRHDKITTVYLDQLRTESKYPGLFLFILSVESPGSCFNGSPRPCLQNEEWNLIGIISLLLPLVLALCGFLCSLVKWLVVAQAETNARLTIPSSLFPQPLSRLLWLNFYLSTRMLSARKHKIHEIL